MTNILKLILVFNKQLQKQKFRVFPIILNRNSVRSTVSFDMTDISLNEKLDRCAELLVATYGDILKQRDRLNEQLDSGFINMSKARSILGCSSLSAMQIPAELEPNVTVRVLEQEAADGADGIKYKDLTFQLSVAAPKRNDEQQQEAASAPLPSWFGALPPMSLKNSHKAFSSSIHTIASICELQARLHSLQLTYKQLVASKKQPVKDDIS